jgi:penicillin-binding protein 1A
VIRLAQDLPTAGQWAIRQWPDVEAALVAAEPATGRVRALVGGFDFARNQFNHASHAWRQPGSSIKPFLYSAALEHGVMPATLVNDAPLVLPGDVESSGWDPKNSDGTYDGPVTLRQALAKSKNLVTIRLVKMLGPDVAREWVGHFGFDPALQPDNLTLALGSGQTSPLQLASAYGVLANGGYRVEPRVIQRITDAKGNVLFEAPPTEFDETARAVPARNVFITNSLLNEVTRTGTAAKAQALLKRPDLYGKTGTTNDAVDAWFAGFQPSLVAVVWMGHDNPRSLGARESGGGLSLPIWIDFMGQALRGVPVDVPAAPDDVLKIGGDWVYMDWAFGGAKTHVGFDDATDALGGPPASAPAPAPVVTVAPAPKPKEPPLPGSVMGPN